MSGSIASDGLTTRPTIRVIRQSPAPPLSGPRRLVDAEVLSSRRRRSRWSLAQIDAPTTLLCQLGAVGSW